MFYNGGAELAPGITLHPVGGHSVGLQFVRVHTRRGWVVVASDTTHFYENMMTGRPFTTAFHIGLMLEAYDALRAQAPTPQHIVPGHDPLVMKFYPPPQPGARRHRGAARRHAGRRGAGEDQVVARANRANVRLPPLSRGEQQMSLQSLNRRRFLARPRSARPRSRAPAVLRAQGAP